MDTMLPAGFVYRNEDQNLKMASLIRECSSNAENYKASNALLLMAHKEGFDYLLYLHNGTSFRDMDNDILLNGCTPNISGQEGKSFQGAGLVASACANHVKPLLLIGSKIDKKFYVGTGQQEGNRWVTRNETKIWGEIILQWVGAEELKKYNVLYGFRFQCQKENGRNDDSRTMFKPQQMAMIAHMMTSGLQNLDLHYCEQEIGYPYNNDSKQKQYASFSAAAEKNKTGSVHRRAISFEGYRERFREQSWTIPCEPFDVVIPTYNDIVLPVKKAHIVIDFYPNETDGGSWMKTLRAGNVDGNFKKDAQNEFGNAPTRKAYLYCPWIYNWAAKNEQDFIHYSRFSDNSVGVYKQHSRFFNEMNLPYADRKGPFMVAQVFLDEFGTIPAHELSPHLIFAIMDRRSDFTFGQQQSISKIILAAAQAAVKNVPADLKELCNKYYKVDVEKFVPLGLEGIKVKKALTHQRNVDVYDLDNDGQPFNGEFSAGKNYRLVVIDNITKASLSPKDVQIHSNTRGVNLRDFTDAISHFDKCEAALIALEDSLSEDPTVERGDKDKFRVWGVAISPMVTRTCGKDKNIKPDEYRHNGNCQPSRNVRLIYGCENINLGIVKEVPKRPKTDTDPPPPGMRRTESGGRSQKEDSPISNSDFYKDLPEGVLVEWEVRTSKLRLNQNHPTVMKYFMTDNTFVSESPRHRKVKELYTSWYSQANSLSQAFAKMEPRASRPDEAWDDNEMNYTLNSIIQSSICTDPQTQRQLASIEKRLDNPEMDIDDE